jgi:hypothetical protein
VLQNRVQRTSIMTLGRVGPLMTRAVHQVMTLAVRRVTTPALLSILLRTKEIT